jgi:hypothetical protein
MRATFEVLPGWHCAAGGLTRCCQPFPSPHA